jgi:hypothetical protein
MEAVAVDMAAVAGQAVLGAVMVRADRLVDSISAVEKNGLAGPSVFSL